MKFVHEFQTRPIDQWPGQFTRVRKRSPFRAGWGDTMELLNSELRHLNAKGVVLLMALTPGEIRLDGRPRADARPQHPGVILSFTASGKAMRFPCDRFDDWADNLRAIALALEALRKVDRYGVTKSGEQYTDWQALPAPVDHGFGNREDALRFLVKLLAKPESEFVTRDQLEHRIREACTKTHPDVAGGSADNFKRVMQAKAMLLA